MTQTRTSRRDVFRHIAEKSTVDWPVYDSTPLYDRSSLEALQADIRTISRRWFEHEEHHSVEQFVCRYPLNYVDFGIHDCYAGSTRYEVDTLFRVFTLKELHGWTHETALVEYLDRQPELCEQLHLESIPDQSTLWRSWHNRFTADLRETVRIAARTVLIRAQTADVAVPREPDQKLRLHEDTFRESEPDDHTILREAEKITDHIGRIVYPVFSLERGDGCEIHENAYWDLQTYLGLRGNLAANEGARSFIHESERNRTPMGHAHRDHIRDLSIPAIREMYRQAVGRLLDEVAETEEFFRAGIVAIDITEADPFTGDRTGHEDEIIGTKENQQTTGEDRVRMVARQLSEPQTANWIASEADWSHEPTKRVLERLVDDGILHRDESGTHTTYYPDYRWQALQEAMRLRDSGHTVEEFTDRLVDMKAQVRDWEEEFGVESPNQLRGTLVDESLDSDEEDHRREIARDWETLQRRIDIVGFTIREWDFLAPTTEPAEVSSLVTSAGLPGAVTVDEIDRGFSDEDIDVWMETAVDPIESEPDSSTEDS